MLTHLLFLIVTVAAFPAMAGDWKHAPKPGDYAVHEHFDGRPAEVKLSSAKDKRYKTMLRRHAKNGPNFAGHFTLIAIGCGLDSFFIAVIDAKTGVVHWPPFGCITLAGGFELPGNPNSEPLRNPTFRIDSRLFVVVGIEDRETADPEDRAATFWVFDKGTFTRVYSIPVPFESSDNAN